MAEFCTHCEEGMPEPVCYQDGMALYVCPQCGHDSWRFVQVREGATA